MLVSIATRVSQDGTLHASQQSREEGEQGSLKISTKPSRGEIWTTATFHNACSWMWTCVDLTAAALCFPVSSSGKLVPHLRYLGKGIVNSNQTFKHVLFPTLVSVALDWAEGNC